MKRLLFIVLLLIQYAVYAQDLQRLVALPSSLTIGDNISSICVDIFKSAPENVLYQSASNPSQTFNAKSYYGLSKTDGKYESDKLSLLLPNGAGESLSANHMQFLEHFVNEFGKGGFDANKLDQIQAYAWAYDGLKQYGLIKEAGDPVMEFNQALNRFAYRFNITDAEEYQTVQNTVKKLVSLNHIQQFKPIIKSDISEIAFDHDHITYQIDGVSRTVAVDYGDASTRSVQDALPGIEKGITEYAETYRQYPGYLSVSNNPDINKKRSYILLFGATRYGGRYQMQSIFTRPINSGKIRKPILWPLQDLYDTYAVHTR